MKKLLLLGALAGVGANLYAQNMMPERRHTDKFEQMDATWRSPNTYRTASGAPGHQYWQQRADYDINITLDDEKQTITGSEIITYTNNSPDELTYLWLQMDQNQQAKTSDSYSTRTSSIAEGAQMHEWFVGRMQTPDFDGGFKIAHVKQVSGGALTYVVNKTMMVVDLPKPLKPGEKFSFSVAWSYNINDRIKLGGRSGYEYFAEDKNYLYAIAQFYPRLCAYNDNHGWQNKQFLGSGEFTLTFGKYRVSLTVPADHVVAATGTLKNPNEVLTEGQRAALEQAATAKEPVIIISEKEARQVEVGRAKTTKTWIFEADSVRDFAFASSRKFIWDAMGVKMGKRTVMAMSYYPKEGNPLWEKYSTRAVAHTLNTYSKYTFEYPYEKAISVHTDDIGMEYPMICFNFGRPEKDGSYSPREKDAMLMVIIHEVGHNYFPMIVNSDERQWAWMDEGINSFMQYLAEKEWKELYEPDYQYRAGDPKQITRYMALDKSVMSPIMTNPEQMQNLGPEAYSKPATALNILRETVMGRELFDRAFKVYAQRWMFKSPEPEDFFRTMEDASAVDLDWFWKGWFYSVDHCDMQLTGVNWYRMKQEKPKEEAEVTETSVPETGGKKPKKGKKDEPEVVVAKPQESGTPYKMFYAALSDEEQQKMLEGRNFYEISIENLGGLVMPVIIEFTYKDGSKELQRLPVEIWNRNDKRISKVFITEKEVVGVVLDPNQEVADIDPSNNAWPKKEEQSQFDKMKKMEGGK